MNEFSFGLLNVVCFLVIALLFVFTALLAGKFLRPNRPSAEKNSAYECGERPIGPAWFNFNPRFYIVALIFVAFDVEIAFTFPVAVVFRDWVAEGKGLFVYVELLVFLSILFLGLVYVWRKNDLDWMKKLDHEVKKMEVKA
ncbi:MAG: NADH-quinone oxidoreductase subunit A [Planctomycetes bacterium]|nr:NADH-quinone oxidoreductase subunit A [Planctomycetota bacterium]